MQLQQQQLNLTQTSLKKSMIYHINITLWWKCCLKLKQIIRLMKKKYIQVSSTHMMPAWFLRNGWWLKWNLRLRSLIYEEKQTLSFNVHLNMFKSDGDIIFWAQFKGVKFNIYYSTKYFIIGNCFDKLILISCFADLWCDNDFVPTALDNLVFEC